MHQRRKRRKRRSLAPNWFFLFLYDYLIHFKTPYVGGVPQRTTVCRIATEMGKQGWGAMDLGDYLPAFGSVERLAFCIGVDPRTIHRDLGDNPWLRQSIRLAEKWISS